MGVTGSVNARPGRNSSTRRWVHRPGSRTPWQPPPLPRLLTELGAYNLHGRYNTLWRTFHQCIFCARTLGERWNLDLIVSAVCEGRPWPYIIPTGCKCLDSRSNGIRLAPVACFPLSLYSPLPQHYYASRDFVGLFFVCFGFGGGSVGTTRDGGVRAWLGMGTLSFCFFLILDQRGRKACSWGIFGKTKEI